MKACAVSSTTMGLLLLMISGCGNRAPADLLSPDTSDSGRSDTVFDTDSADTDSPTYGSDEPDTDTATETEMGTGTGTGTTSDTAIDRDSDTLEDSDTGIASSTDTQTNTVADNNTASETASAEDGETDSQSGTLKTDDSGVDSGEDTDTESGLVDTADESDTPKDTETETETESVSDTGAETDTGIDTPTDTGSQTDTGFETPSDTGTDTGMETDSITETATESETGSTGDTESEIGSTGDTGSETGSTGDTGSETGSGGDTEPALCPGPRNVIFFIGDGMGFEQVEAARLYKNDRDGTSDPLFFESLTNFPTQSQVITDSLSSPASATDSAAAGTAMATGTKVQNGYVSYYNNAILPSMLEYYQQRCGKATGLISTVQMTEATPATFGAHTGSRSNYDEIAADYLLTQPTVLLGGGGQGMTVGAFSLVYDYVVTTKTELMDIQEAAPIPMVSGQFGLADMPYEYDQAGNYDTNDWPHLHEMTEKSLALLSADADGFFLMVEGGHIDQAGHDNNIRRMVHETLEFEETVQLAYDAVFAESSPLYDPETLIIVTADHETGGLNVSGSLDGEGYPVATWSSIVHTRTNVPLFTAGVWSEQFEAATIDNTYYYTVLTGDWDGSVE